MRTPLSIVFVFIAVACFGQWNKSSKDTIIIPQDKIHFLGFEDHCIPHNEYTFSDALSHVFNSQKEVDEYYKCKLSENIDFNKYTLVHFPMISTNSVYRVTRQFEMVGDTVICNVEVVEPILHKGEGITEAGRYYINEILLPKISHKCNAVYKYREIRIEDFYKDSPAGIFNRKVDSILNNKYNNIRVNPKYKIDKINGFNEEISYWSPGKVSSEIPFVDWQLTGKVKLYDQKGHLTTETDYVNWKKEGFDRTYYENGKIFIETLYVNNQRNGIRKEYDSIGVLEYECPYKNDIKEGVCKVYYPDGKLKGEYTYHNDWKRKVIEYDKSGKATSVTHYSVRQDEKERSSE